ncbi:ATP synthase subunit C lysine N-methyltransferase-like [Ylistrum balloti]|uniref:ATP synthase subunit C lysine N-methyltransferase-like n=1 Tax=Ylistrum balloti TaxID=509963 RepID=UPI002905811B|nr:ATP synthase subunit C lysine N-methyltransferase-like [Ylistrum balloti]XP_060075962.1 ATP synthase subunit C lysine N-methyltransferase-like [Ylistrum balloti]
MGIESVLESSEDDKTSIGLTKKGSVLLGVFGGLFVGVYTLTGPFLAPALRKICLPFLPASPTQMRNVFKALGSRKGSLLDIGSGDGRIVIEAAKNGYKASGIELNMWLVLYSRLAARRAGMNTQATFKRQDLWKTDVSPYNNVVIFGVRQMMEPLEQKLEKELAQESVVVACRFRFPNWEPVLTLGEGVDTVWLYRINSLSHSTANTKQSITQHS